MPKQITEGGIMKSTENMGFKENTEEIEMYHVLHLELSRESILVDGCMFILSIVVTCGIVDILTSIINL